MAASLQERLPRLGDRLAYRRREVVALTILAVSLVAGLAVDHWRGRDPATMERLESGPPPPPAVRLPPRHTRERATSKARRPPHSAKLGRTNLAPERAATAPLDLNQASAADLAGLPGVGPHLAQRILARREAAGGFASPAELRGIPGFGPRRLAVLRPLVTVPVAPGLDPADGSAAREATVSPTWTEPPSPGPPEGPGR